MLVRRCAFPATSKKREKKAEKIKKKKKKKRRRVRRIKEEANTLRIIVESFDHTVRVYYVIKYTRAGVSRENLHFVISPAFISRISTFLLFQKVFIFEARHGGWDLKKRQSD